MSECVCVCVCVCVCCVCVKHKCEYSMNLELIVAECLSVRHIIVGVALVSV